MFHLRSCFNISIKVYRQPTIYKVINPRRLFRTSAISLSRSCEIKFAHTVLEINPKCTVLREHSSNVVESAGIDFEQHWDDLTADGIVENLRQIENHCNQNGTTLSDEKFDKLVDLCTERCFDFTDDQLIQSLEILARQTPAESSKSRNFVELWNAFDDACVDRIPTWDFDKILYVCDHWHHLRLGRLNKFNFQASLKLGKKLRKLPPHQLLQLMFYLSITNGIKHLDMIEAEVNLMKCVDDFSLNEIAVVCMGLLGTQTKIRTPKLIAKIYERSIQEIDTIEDIALACILKALHHSCNINHLALVQQMLYAVNGQLFRLSPLTCLHASLLGTKLNICHHSCVEQTLHRFSDDVKSMRTMDFERISYLMGFFDFESESNVEKRLCQQLLAELKNRVNEIVLRPRSFAKCLHFLTMKGYHDEEMISVVLSPMFLMSAYENQIHYDHELFGLDAYVKINLKATYTGNQLTKQNRRYMGKMMTSYIPDRSKDFRIDFTDKILLELKETSDELCTHTYWAHPLPHFNSPDILIAYDKNSNTGIDIAHKLPPIYTGTIIDRSMLVEGLNTDAANVEIVHIIVGGFVNFVRDTLKLKGFTRQKIEQSKILGLRPILVPHFDWNRLSEEERKLYVKQKIDEVLLEK